MLPPRDGAAYAPFLRDEKARSAEPFGVTPMSLGTILLIVLILFLIGAFPSWPHSANWGYLPSGGIGTLIVIVLVLMVIGRL